MTAYIGIIERENTITVDGYSSAKTILGVMRDIERVIKNITCVSFQSDCYSCISKKEAEEILSTCTMERSCDGFYVIVDDVSCASLWNEETEEMEYKDRYNYYFCTRLVK